MPPSAAAVAAVALLGSLFTSSGFVGAPSMAPRRQVSSMARAYLALDDTIYTCVFRGWYQQYNMVLYKPMPKGYTVTQQQVSRYIYTSTSVPWYRII